jgi:hypothetical protein
MPDEESRMECRVFAARVFRALPEYREKFTSVCEENVTADFARACLAMFKEIVED